MIWIKSFLWPKEYYKKYPKEYSIREILIAINKALDILYKQDYDLISNAINEDTVTSHFASFLLPKFPNYYVDAFYNKSHIPSKNITDTKRATMPDGKEKKIYPDIIVHLRNTHVGNLLCIECKGYWNTNISERNKDKKVLAFLTRTVQQDSDMDLNGHLYCYMHGFFIEYGKTRREVRIFRIENGTTTLQKV